MAGSSIRNHCRINGFKCLALLVIPASLLPQVVAFNFSYSAPTQCDTLNISWSGGRGPYSLLITPFFKPQQNISLPNSAFNDETGNGTFAMQLTLQAGQEFLLVMSDADGFGTGGTSNVLTVGQPISGQNCNTTQPNADFTFQANDALLQCREYTFSAFGGAVQPVTIFALIPLGQAFTLYPPEGATSFDWQANVAAGTSLAFVMTDAKGRRGGTSNLVAVGDSDDSSCINVSSPHSTADAIATQTGGVQATQTVNVSGGISSGVIAGAVVGGIAGLVVVGFIAFFCIHWHRRQVQKSQLETGASNLNFIHNDALQNDTSRLSRIRSSLIPGRHRLPAQRAVDLMQSSVMRDQPLQATSPLAPSLGSFPPRSEYEPNPYILPSDVSAIDGHSDRLRSELYSSEANYDSQNGHARVISQSDINDTSALKSTSPESPLNNHIRQSSFPHSITSGNGTSRKGSMPGTARSTRFILHTDLDDIAPVDGPDDVVELPPQYSDRRNSSTALSTGPNEDATSPPT